MWLLKQISQVGRVVNKTLAQVNYRSANSVRKDPETMSMLHSQVELKHLFVHVDGTQGTVFTCADEW